MKPVWTRSALADLQGIRSYIAKEAPETAARVGSRIVEAVDQLGKFPDSGRPGRVKGTRELRISGTPYFIPYRTQEDQVQLLCVFHGRQDYP